MSFVRARLIEKYKTRLPNSEKESLQKVVHEERYFSSMDKSLEWYETFKDQLWEDDPSKVSLIEGIYVHLENVTDINPLNVDDLSKPQGIVLNAKFRPGVSYKYAV